MGMKGGELKRMEIQGSQKQDPPVTTSKRFANGKEPPLAEADKRPKVLIVESEGNLLSIIEDILKEKCNVQFGYRNYSGIDCVLRAMPHDLDVVVIGVGFSGNPEQLARQIRTRYPQTRIIKLASTSEHRRITERMSAIKEAVFDNVLNFSYVDQLPRLISGE